ncbi:MAG: hypothetical protein U0359_26520 [Byssovorax sp.]
MSTRAGRTRQQALEQLERDCVVVGLTVDEAIAEKADELSIRAFLRCIPDEGIKRSRVVDYVAEVLDRAPERDLSSAWKQKFVVRAWMMTSTCNSRRPNVGGAHYVGRCSWALSAPKSIMSFRSRWAARVMSPTTSYCASSATSARVS